MSGRTYTHIPARDDAVELTKPQFLKKLRESRGLSKKRFSELVGVSRMTIIRWESGAHAPKNCSIIKLKAILVDLSELMELNSIFGWGTGLTNKTTSRRLLDTPLGACIRGIRAEKGMTQLELAACVGIQPCNMSKWESGIAIPRLRNINIMIHKLGLSDTSKFELLTALLQVKKVKANRAANFEYT